MGGWGEAPGGNTGPESAGGVGRMERADEKVAETKLIYFIAEPDPTGSGLGSHR